mmetsp:Transcript_36930/g.59316  ORF Transcript_36930/g.59316 Transcript_36930/m.59316 type:complete len:206 (+) Transcript_36930:102-719(+)
MFVPALLQECGVFPYRALGECPFVEVPLVSSSSVVGSSDPPAVAALLAGLRSFTGWPESAAQRKGVAAQNYLTLKRRDVAGFERWLAGSASDSRLGPAADKAAEKVAAMAIVEIWRLSSDVFTSVVPDAVFDYLTITRGFRGSPHIDHKDTTHQHVMALGDFIGGELCAEEMVEGEACTQEVVRACDNVDNGGDGGVGGSGTESE